MRRRGGGGTSEEKAERGGGKRRSTRLFTKKIQYNLLAVRSRTSSKLTFASCV